MSDVPETPRDAAGDLPDTRPKATSVTNPRVLALWRELNVLAETDADAAAIVAAYRQVGHWRSPVRGTIRIESAHEEGEGGAIGSTPVSKTGDPSSSLGRPASICPMCSNLGEADHRYTTREIDRIAREPRRRLVLCASCNTMTHIPTGTVCAQCLAQPLERSSTPMFSSKLPEPDAAGGAITREDVKGFAELSMRVDHSVSEPYFELLQANRRYTRVVDPVKWLQVYDPGLLENPVCEHGVPCAHVSAFKSCFICGTSEELRRLKHERRQSGGSCDCPVRDGEPCVVREVDCRVRSYHNSRLSVRSWFRKMRAAEFERDRRKWIAQSRTPYVGRLDDGAELQRFFGFRSDPDERTLFDVQKVVDRETAPHYPRFPDEWTRSERSAWRRLFDTSFHDGNR